MIQNHKGKINNYRSNPSYFIFRADFVAWSRLWELQFKRYADILGVLSEYLVVESAFLSSV